MLFIPCERSPPSAAKTLGMCLDPAQHTSRPSASRTNPWRRARRLPPSHRPPPPPPEPPHPPHPHTIQDLPFSVPLNHSPGKSPQSLHPATGQNVGGQIRGLRGRLGWVCSGIAARKKCCFCYLPLQIFRLLCLPQPSLDVGALLSPGIAEEWVWAGR